MSGEDTVYYVECYTSECVEWQSKYEKWHTDDYVEWYVGKCGEWYISAFVEW